MLLSQSKVNQGCWCCSNEGTTSWESICYCSANEANQTRTEPDRRASKRVVEDGGNENNDAGTSKETKVVRNTPLDTRFLEALWRIGLESKGLDNDNQMRFQRRFWKSGTHQDWLEKMWLDIAPFFPFFRVIAKTPGITCLLVESNGR